MGGPGRDPMHGIGDVLGGQRLDILIDLGGLFVIAMEAHIGELGAAAQTGLDIGHAQGSAGQIGAQIEAELAHEGLGRAVDVATGIGPAAGHRAEVEDMAAVALDHAGQQGARDLNQARAVGVDHGLPVVQARALRRLEPEREAGVVDQHIDGGKLGRQHGGQGLDGGTVAHIELERQQRVAEFGRQRLEAILAPGGRDHAMAGLYELAGNGRAEAGGCTGDEYDQGDLLG